MVLNTKAERHQPALWNVLIELTGESNLNGCGLESRSRNLGYAKMYNLIQDDAITFNLKYVLQICLIFVNMMLVVSRRNIVYLKTIQYKIYNENYFCYHSSNQ